MFSSMGNVLGKWDRRWFVLSDGLLCYFKSEDDALAGKAVGTLDTLDCNVERVDVHSFNVITPGRTLSMRAPSADEARAWIDSLEASAVAALSPRKRASTRSSRGSTRTCLTRESTSCARARSLLIGR